MRGEIVGPRDVERSAMGLGERRAAARNDDGFSHDDVILLRQRREHAADQLREVAVRSARARTQAHDHRVTRRNHHRVLAHVTRCADRILGHALPLPAAIEPPQPAVALVLVRRRRRRNEFEPVVGKNALALPHAVPQVQQAEARPVARRAVIEAGHDEVAPRVGLEHEVARADLVEQRALRERQVVLALAPPPLP